MKRRLFQYNELSKIMNGDEENGQPPRPSENGNGQDPGNGDDPAERRAMPEEAPEEGWITEQLHRLQRYFMNEPIPKRLLDIIRGKKDDDDKH